MLKKAKLSYKGMNQDVSKLKRSPEFYFDACNIRIQATDSGTTGAVTNDKGNLLVYQLASGQVIIGSAVLKDYLVLFSTSSLGIDKITRVKLQDYSGFELFSGNLNFDISSSMDTEVYYESDDIQKVYWVDGINQLRHINIISNRLYTEDEATLFDAVPEVAFSAPYVNSIDFGGIHTAGMIQYAYNLIKRNGSQSAISPISELYPLNKNLGGGKVNEQVGKILNIAIDLVDTRYDIIRLYSVKYTSYNEQPSINVIAEETIGGNNTFRFSDDGRVIRTITPEAFLFLGGTAFVPTTITSKYNRLIIGNIKELYFDVKAEDYDTRAYRFPKSSNTTSIWKDGDQSTNTSLGYLEDSNSVKLSTSGDEVPVLHDCQNTYFDGLFGNYNYKVNSTSIGATGTNIEVEVVQKLVKDPRNVLKSNEIYRLGIEFYNNRGQSSPPKWICDIKIPMGNLDAEKINTLKVTIKNTDVLISKGVVGWRVLRVEREDVDKTVLCQGIVNPSIYQKYNDTQEDDLTSVKGAEFANIGLIKLPSPFMRNNYDLKDQIVKPDDAPSDYPRINKILHGNPLNLPILGGSYAEWPFPEIFRTGGSNDGNQNSYEDTRLFQFYSPEVMFLNQSFGDNLRFKTIASVNNGLGACGEWCKQISTENKDSVLIGDLLNDVREDGVISLYKTSKYNKKITGNAEPNQMGLLGPAGGDTKRIAQYQYYRKYTNDPSFVPTTTILGLDQEWQISGSPTILAKGVSSKSYDSDTIDNIDDKYKFSNHLFTMLTDRNNNDRIKEPIISVNSIGGPCLNIIELLETPLETILSESGVSGSDSTGLIEIYRSIASQYGGSTYEARSRNSYLRIGKYLPISENSNQIDSAGDVFVGSYKFERIIPNTTQVNNNKYLSLCEIVEFPVETSIDLTNRSDYSVDGWDAYFQPTYDEYHNYNRVYSQQPIFNRTTATPFTFQERKVFDNRINATKVKISGEIVDSWTDILVNEELYVDGKYGAITKVIQNNDIVYCLQEQAVSRLEIEPRVQTVATNGTSIELGRGSVLYNYQYLNTNSGCVNADSIFNSQNSVYYVDIINKSLNRIVGHEVVGLSDIHALHSLMNNNLDYTSLNNKTNLCGVFDQITNDAYFTIPQHTEGEPGLTISFNEQSNVFTSRYSFIPDKYIYTAFGLISIKNGRDLWKHGVGEYGNYYGDVYDSFITLLASPEPDTDCVFNNGEFKSDCTLNGVDQSTKTITSLQCWNEYQDTHEQQLLVGKNIQRKFRDWNFFIPRNYGTLQRMRGQSLYLKLLFDNTNNYKFTLHDFIISFDAIQKQ